MNDKMKRLLTPEGVRDLLPGLARQKRELEGKIQEIFGRWGYREVATPAFEYSANFVAEMKADLEDKVYRFPDERGRTLVLRPDFTLPLARVAATHLAGGPKPLRLCYGGSIYRYASSQQGKQREQTQAGVELIGIAGAGADAEVMALAADVLQELGLQEFTLCLGHAGFLETLLNAHGVEAEDRENIIVYFNKKDFVSLKEMVGSLDISQEAKDAILRVPHLRGGKEVLEAAAALVPAGEAAGPLAVLEEAWDVLEDYGVTRFITLDLGLVRMMDYYTGIVFEGYTGGLGYPICGGGRYDQLLENFGPELPAVGFALNIDHLLTKLQRLKKLAPQNRPVFVGYGEDGRAAALLAAQRLRQAGDEVLVDMAPRSAEEAKELGLKLGAAQLIYHSADNTETFRLADEGRNAGC
ncbi:ATP phosphoribosyltransferase regulatory subunit [Dethiobacter alkaliphilus]|uniref:ATP phosphoribosyltransferase regulatory subunit n=1 Tax=Dethiobacter alkaliphilus AHT 1 TaxID=555088 RepID=C0GG01_DETAL|nr:ATP phosphoribosyltransferase regulatory subunit [Dethiobacter alkaliphilus]EEG77690.1 histidyl-tRNA synthetase [Dethiobacter alkaliphilus AHT 1]